MLLMLGTFEGMLELPPITATVVLVAPDADDTFLFFLKSRGGSSAYILARFFIEFNWF